MIRAFVALALPDPLRARLTALQAGLPVGRPVGTEAMHVTLAFLGEQREPVLEDLHLALSVISGPALSLRLDGLGLFGGAKPRNLHAVVAPDPALSALRRRVCTAVRETGIALPRERFVPHVTLARFPAVMAGEDMAALHRFLAPRIGFAAGPVEVSAFTLFESHLRPDGAVYGPLAEYPLG